MKKNTTFLFVLLFPIVSFCQTERSYTIYGEAKNLDGYKIELTGSELLAETVVKDGNFMITGTISETPLITMLMLKGKNGYASYKIILEEAEYFIDISREKLASGNPFSSEIRSNSKADNEFRKGGDPIIRSFVRERDSIINLYRLSALQQNKDSLQPLRERYEAIASEWKEYVWKRVLSDTENVLTACEGLSVPTKDSTFFKNLYNALSEKIQKGQIGKMYLDKIKKANYTPMDKTPEVLLNHALQQAKDFSAQDINGKTFSMSDYKGKWVLLDFWASWCAPCRSESPNLKRVFAKYKDKGLELIAISCDKNKENWLKAIAKDDVAAFRHVLEEDDGSSPIAELYAVTYLPSNFLIDPSGRIVATDLRGEKLEEAIKMAMSAYNRK